MKDKILVNVVTDHAFECDTNIIGRAGEGGTARFEITLTDEMCDCSVYLDFEKPNGETYRTDPLTVVNNVVVYDIPVYLLSESGEIKVQLVLIGKDGSVWKSEEKKYANLESINATTSVPIPVFPVGTANITANGTYDITHYAKVKVSVALENLKPELDSIEAKIADLNAIFDDLNVSDEGIFYINGTEYTFKLGMTWSEFVSSSYNTNGDVLVDEDDYVGVAETGYLTWYNEKDDLDEEVFGSDKIINGMAYTT